MNNTNRILIISCLLLGTVAWPLDSAGDTRSLTRLDQPRYVTGVDCADLRVEDADENLDPAKPDSLQAEVMQMAADGTSVGDREGLLLVETGADTGVFRNVLCLPVLEGAQNDFDGVLQVGKGDFIGAVYHDLDNPPPPQGVPADPLAAFALYDVSVDVAMVAGGVAKGDVQVQIEPGILPPEFAVVPGEAPGEPDRPLAMAAPDGGFPVLYGEDQVLYQPVSLEDLSEFLARRGGTVISSFSIPSDNPNGPVPLPYYWIRVDLATVDASDFAYMAELSDAQGNSLVSSDGGLRLLALVLEEQISGEAVMLNPVSWAMAPPTTNEAGGGNGFGQDGKWMADPRVNLREAITFVDVIEGNVPRSVETAFIGSGFASPGDFLPLTPPASLDYGVGFGSIPQAECGSGGCDFSASASGPFSMICAGGAGPRCTWHDTLSFGVAGAVADNAFGSFGVAGHARDFSGVDGVSGVIDPVLIGIQFPFFGTLAQGINASVDRGVDLISISAGFACEPVADIDLCNGATRFAVRAVCFGVGILISSAVPGLGPLIAAIGCAAIDVFIHSAGLNRRGALRSAVARAVAADIPVIASGTETVNIPIIGTSGPFDAVDIEFLPCVLPGVTCVGAMDLIGSQYSPHPINPNGQGLDIWAPVDPVSTSTPLGGPGRFAGTSAAAPFITGVVALMKAVNPALSRPNLELMLQQSSIPLDVAPTGGCVGVDGRCTGSVDVLGAVEAAAGGMLTCSAWDETVENDSMGSADPVSVSIPTRPGEVARVEVMTDGAIHAFPFDDDWFTFDLGATPTPTVATRVSLSMPVPAFGALDFNLWDQEASALLGSGPVFETFLRRNNDYAIHVDEVSNVGTDDNCYVGATLAIEIMTTPETDSCEPNDSLVSACPVASSWTSTDFLCRWNLARRDLTAAVPICSDIFEDLVPGSGVTPEREAHLAWSFDLDERSLHHPVDQDFFRVELPDLADPADGGYDDISPSGSVGPPEPLPECSYVERQDLSIGGLDPTVNISVGGRLYVRVVPTGNTKSIEAFSPLGEEVRLYGGAANEGSGLLAIVDCPRSNGIDELTFSVGERADAREPFDVGGYQVEMTYHVPIMRSVPSSLVDVLDPPISPMPCLSLGTFGGPGPAGLPFSGAGMPPAGLPAEDFPFCPPGLDLLDPVLELAHPLDSLRPGCENGGGPACREAFAFEWPDTFQPLDLRLSLTADASFIVLDEAGKFVAEALPAVQQGMSQAMAAMGAPLNTIEKVLFVPDLAPGRYYLMVEGPVADYRLEFTAPLDDPDGDRVEAELDNCLQAWNPEQKDDNQDGVGTTCQCGDGDGNGFIQAGDAFSIATCVVNPASCNVDVEVGEADNNGLLQAADAFAVAGVVQGGGQIPAYTLRCNLRPDGLPPGQQQ